MTVMDFGARTLLYMGIILLALIIRPFARKTCLSYPAILVILGIVIAAILRFVEFDISFNETSFQTVVFYIFLPTLIFQIAYIAPLDEFLPNAGQVLYLGLIGMVISLVTIALTMYFLVGKFHAVNWTMAFVIGTILAMVSATALLDTLKATHLEKTSLIPLFRWEALLGTIFAVAALNVIVELNILSVESITANMWIVEFFEEVAGGIFIGLAVGSLSLGILMLDHEPGVQTFVTITSVYFAFILSHNLLHVSGIMAVATQGVLYSNLAKPLNSDATRSFLNRFWGMSNLIAYTCTFLLAGIMLNLPMLKANWAIVVLAAIAVIIARLLIVYFVMPLWCLMLPNSNIEKGLHPIVFWGGTRGAVAIVLALSIQNELVNASLVKTIIFGTITLGLLCQIPLSCWHAHKLKQAEVNKG